MLRVNLLADREIGERRRRISDSLAGSSGLQRARDAMADPWGLLLIVTAVLAVGGVGWSWHSQSTRAVRLEDELASAVADSTRLADLVSASDSLEGRAEDAGRRFETLARMERDRDAWARTLHALAAALPGRSWLTEIRERDPLPDLRVSVRGQASTPLAATAYARDLEGFGWIERVHLEGASRLEAGEPDGQSFILTVDYRATDSGRGAASVISPGGG